MAKQQSSGSDYPDVQAAANKVAFYKTKAAAVLSWFIKCVSVKLRLALKKLESTYHHTGSRRRGGPVRVSEGYRNRAYKQISPESVTHRDFYIPEKCFI